MARHPYKDPFYVLQRQAWARARSQASFRGEPWTLTFEDWQEFWPREFWDQRGRGPGCLCLTRINVDLPWSRTNCCRMDRLDAVRIGRLRHTRPDRHLDPSLWRTAVYLK